jgi:hypothetical protein
MEVLKMWSLIVSAGVSFVLGLITLSSKKDLKYRLFFWFAAGTGVVMLCGIVIHVFENNTSNTLFIFANTIIGSIVLLSRVFLYQLILALYDDKKKYFTVTIGYILTCIILSLRIVQNYFLNNVAYLSNDLINQANSSAVNVFISGFTCFVHSFYAVLILAILFKLYKNTTTYKKQQLKSLFYFAFIKFGFIIVVNFLLFTPYHGIIWFTPYAYTFFVVAAFLIMVKNKLLNIDLTGRNIATNFVFVSVMFGLFYLFMQYEHTYHWNFFAGAIFFSGMLALTSFHKKIKDFVFYNIAGKKYRYWLDLKQLAQKPFTARMNSNLVYYTLSRTYHVMQLEDAIFFRISSDKSKYVSISNMKDEFKSSTIGRTSKIVQYLYQTQKSIVADRMFFETPEEQTLEKEINEHNARFIMPLFERPDGVIGKDGLVGILMLGAKKNKSLYNKIDVIRLEELQRVYELYLASVLCTEDKKYYLLRAYQEGHADELPDEIQELLSTISSLETTKEEKSKAIDLLLTDVHVLHSLIVKNKNSQH